MNLPIVRTPQNIYCFEIDVSAIWSTALHTHDSYEIFLCVKGKGEQRTDKKAYTMHVGALYVYAPGVAHVCIPAKPDGCTGLVLNLHPGAFASSLPGDRDSRMILDRLSTVTANNNNYLELSAAGIKACTGIFRSMVEEYRRKLPAFECAVKIRIQELLLLVLRDKYLAANLQKDFVPVRSVERMHDVLRFLKEHYMEPVSIEQIARMACMSRSHFHAVFKEATGRPLVQYLNELRTEAAAWLLSETEMTIVRIGLECGFPCASHFYHIFKSITHKTPREFRLAKETGN